MPSAQFLSIKSIIISRHVPYPSDASKTVLFSVSPDKKLQPAFFENTEFIFPLAITLKSSILKYLNLKDVLPIQEFYKPYLSPNAKSAFSKHLSGTRAMPAPRRLPVLEIIPPWITGSMPVSKTFLMSIPVGVPR